ncbi:hypothetical protein [Fodinicola acaciae]|uniref:hypothetical protein n=1 Tax=Fodinicola acaciae TaxID=2681555 RepID=UPI0013D4B1D4|nr:hypothetical protein [Fodinicola acaciae]
MTDLLVTAVWICFFALNMGLLVWLARRVRRRGVGDSVLSPIEEIWHPAIREYRFETQAQEERMVARTSPDDPLDKDA